MRKKWSYHVRGLEGVSLPADTPWDTETKARVLLDPHTELLTTANTIQELQQHIRPHMRFVYCSRNTFRCISYKSTCSGKPSILFWPLVWMKQRALCGRGLVVVMGMGRGDWYCWMDTLLIAPSYCWSRAVRWGGGAEVIIMVCCWCGLWTPGCGQDAS